MRLLKNGHITLVDLFWGIAMDPGSLPKDKSHAALANMEVAGLLPQQSKGKQSQGQGEPRSSDRWGSALSSWIQDLLFWINSLCLS